MDDVALDAREVSSSRAEMIDRVKSVVPLIEDHALEHERQRQIDPAVIAALRDTGMYRAMQPKRFGGMEEDFTVMIDLAKVTGAACGSTAWVTNLYVVHQWLLSTFPVEAQDEVFSAEPNVAMCGSYAPVGKAKRVDGGMKLTGRFQYSSGCDNASWSMMGVTIAPAKDGDAPEQGFALVPLSDCEIEDDWFTAGLSGTGSKTLLVEDAFVPGHRFVSFDHLLSGTAPGADVHENPLYKISFMAALPVCIASPALGIAQGALMNFVDQIKVRETRGAVKGGGLRMAEFEMVQGRIAEASAYVDAATLLLTRDMNEAVYTVMAGQQLDVATRIRNRRDHGFAVKLCVDAMDALYRCTGGKGLFLDNIVQRAWKDVHAISHHVSLNWDPVSTMYGQHRLGLEPRGQY